MKKLTIGIYLLIVGLIAFKIESAEKFSDVIIDSYIPQTYVLNTNNASSSVQISSITNIRACLTDFTFTISSGTPHRLALLDGTLAQGTTIYEVFLPTVTIHFNDLAYPNAICSSPGNSLTISISTGPSRMNYQGYYRRRP